MRDIIVNKYFEYLFNLTCNDRFSENISFRRLLHYLHDVEFTYLIPNDANRAEDGLELRRRFLYEHCYDRDCLRYLSGPCSVLEMMVALSIRCEESIMGNPDIGDRTRQWFWGMIMSLGLGSMSDDYFDESAVYDIVHRFLDRQYDFDGAGGLFTIPNCSFDLRTIEIWYQLCWYLDSVV